MGFEIFFFQENMQGVELAVVDWQAHGFMPLFVLANGQVPLVTKKGHHVIVIESASNSPLVFVGSHQKLSKINYAK